MEPLYVLILTNEQRTALAEALSLRITSATPTTDEEHLAVIHDGSLRFGILNLKPASESFLLAATVR